MDRSELLNAGGHLANCAYNLAQSPRLTDAERRSLDECRKAWDAAVTAAPPPPAEQASGELSHAIDLMRDMYMSKAQRESYERILAAALSQRPVADEGAMKLREVAKRNLRSLIERLGDDADKRTMLLCLEELS